MTRTPLSRSKGQKSRSPGRFTHRGVYASSSCSGDRGNVFTVGTYCCVVMRGRIRGGTRRFGAHRGRGAEAYCGGSRTASLFLLQKRAMRLITNSPWRAHTAPLFNRLRVLTIFEINKLQTACFMFKINKQQLPSYFNDLFIRNSALHSHNRQSSDYMSYSRTKIRQSIIPSWMKMLKLTNPAKL